MPQASERHRYSRVKTWKWCSLQLVLSWTICRHLYSYQSCPGDLSSTTVNRAFLNNLHLFLSLSREFHDKYPIFTGVAEASLNDIKIAHGAIFPIIRCRSLGSSVLSLYTMTTWRWTVAGNYSIQHRGTIQRLATVCEKWKDALDAKSRNMKIKSNEVKILFFFIQPEARTYYCADIYC